MRNILTLWNYKFLTLSNPSPPEEVAVDPPGDKREANLPKNKGEDAPLSKGEEAESNTWRDAQNGAKNPSNQTQRGNAKKRSAETDIDPRELQQTREIKKDYWYLHNPFPDEEEVGIACINKEEAYVVIPDDNCHSLCQAKGSEDWEEWEQAMHTELDQLHRMGTWKLVEKPPGVVPIANK